MEIDLKTLTPWPEINRDMKNMRSLTIVAAGGSYNDKADMVMDEHGNMTLTLGDPQKAKKKAKK